MAPAFSKPRPAEQFIGRLADLGDGDLRALRRAIGRPLGSDVLVFDIWRGVWRDLRRKHAMARWAYYLVATLYPWHPARGGTGNFGDAMRELRPDKTEQEDRKRADRRFLGLLDAKGPALQSRLTGRVRLLARERVPVDWVKLLEDLSNWYSAAHEVQRAWAHSYFRE